MRPGPHHQKILWSFILNQSNIEWWIWKKKQFDLKEKKKNKWKNKVQIWHKNKMARDKTKKK
jgi:hypothetical protein